MPENEKDEKEKLQHKKLDGASLSYWGNGVEMAIGLLTKEENSKKYALSLFTISQLSVTKGTIQECPQVTVKE